MRWCALLAFGFLLAGCGISHQNADEESRPDRAVGTRGRVLYPGETPPPLSDSSASSRTSSNGETTSQQSSQGPAGDEDFAMIGGSTKQISEKQKVRDTPLGPLTVLFGYPFWIFGKSIRSSSAVSATCVETTRTSKHSCGSMRARAGFEDEG